ncbi:hypothetical protein [Thioclava sp. GXIMD4216]|uniref:Lipoprotein n=1 Tax=Thioclava litoralis TaxID=3076557 RepID=A0ABZ1DVE0_9RHOB|nr:hypothetical protein RPE78_08300 [Thioclava sp. FTW29]
MRGRLGLALGSALALLGCAKVPVAQAEKICLTRVQEARPISGSVGLGVRDGKPATAYDVKLGISTDTFRDPSEVYKNCVYQYSGQLPQTPLYDR